MKEMKKVQQGMASMNIGGGLLQFITSLEHPSLTSQERKLSLTSISSSYLTTSLTNRIRTNVMSSLENNKKEHTV
jgi:hypothetical protein